MRLKKDNQPFRLQRASRLERRRELRGMVTIVVDDAIVR